MWSAREICVFRILKVLQKKNYMESMHKLEEESRLYFNVGYFIECIKNGEWEEVENYLSAFTKVGDNFDSSSMFFEIRKQKYLEALDSDDNAKAVKILRTELQVFPRFYSDRIKECSSLLPLPNFRKSKIFSKYGDIKSARARLIVALRILIGSNTVFRRKLRLPNFEGPSLQHLNCENPNGAHGVNNLPHIPKAVVANLNQGSTVKSIDFHPSDPFLLLVGTDNGDVSVWEVARGERLSFRNFKVWDLSACSEPLQTSLANEYTASVTRVRWSPEGAFIGVAYSKHIIHIYTYDDAGVQNHLEIDAHTGYVSDLAFGLPAIYYILTCGEDKTIKVFDVVTGAKLHTFKGHGAPVYSLCPHVQDNNCLFSTSVDGEGIVWSYDEEFPISRSGAHDKSCMTLTLSADGQRLFSCGFKDDEPSIIEWNLVEWSGLVKIAAQASHSNELEWGTIKHRYCGLGKHDIQFDTCSKNRILAAGDECQIKFWDMNNTNLLTTVDAEGGLPESPRVKFNREGTLLAVSTSGNGVKILVNNEGARLMQDISKCALIPEYPITIDLDTSKIQTFMKINNPSQLRSLKLPDSSLSVRIMKLDYTNSGRAVLALAENAVHQLWKWESNDLNTTGKAITTVPPRHYQPQGGILMMNDIGLTNLKEAIHCFVLTDNGDYVMSASGGKISLFIMSTFRRNKTFMTRSPAATSLAVYPQDNNVVAIGMEDFSIQIYNPILDKVISKLRGHQSKVTGLAFSKVLNVLVSSGADAQLCVWNTEGWKKKGSMSFPSGQEPNPSAQTRVQFHNDQTHILVVHETLLAIYDVSKLKCVYQWGFPLGSWRAITDATYSGDSQSIYASFQDGSICVFTASPIELRRRILSTSYLPSNSSSRVHALTIAANPKEPNQFAVGLTDGGVVVMEPLESEGGWEAAPSNESGQSSSDAAGQNQS